MAVAAGAGGGGEMGKLGGKRRHNGDMKVEVSEDVGRGRNER